MIIPQIDWFSSLPIVFFSGMIVLILLVEAFVKKSADASFWLSVLGILVTIGFSALTVGQRGVSFSGMILQGGYGSFFNILFLLSALVTIVLSRDYLRRSHSDFGEFYLLILLATLGMMLMASAEDLIMIFLGLELMSVCLYVLAGFFRGKLQANEASLKYFLLGAFSTGFLLYGIALLYGAAHTTNIGDIVAHFQIVSQVKYFWLGIGLLLVGLAFKVAAVPFHMWVPDVYEGSPTPVTGFMSTGAKAAAFSALVLVFGFPAPLGDNVKLVVGILATASMILGNVVALSQTNLKRMLAYSSIAHAGYMLIGIAAMNQLGKEGILFYITSYLFMNLGAFGIIAMLEGEEGSSVSLDDYAGLAHRRPFIAALMAVFMFTLSGLPPFGGFFGKYYLFLAAINANLTWLAIVGVLASVVGAFYYIRVVVVMYFQDVPESAAASSGLGSSLSTFGITVIALVAIAVVQLGVYPAFLLDVIQHLF